MSSNHQYWVIEQHSACTTNNETSKPQKGYAILRIHGNDIVATCLPTFELNPKCDMVSSEKPWYINSMVIHPRKGFLNYFTSSDSNRDKLFCHSFWHPIWKYIWHVFSDLLSGIHSGILSGIYFDILSDMGTAEPQPRAEGRKEGRKEGRERKRREGKGKERKGRRKQLWWNLDPHLAGAEKGHTNLYDDSFGNSVGMTSGYSPWIIARISWDMPPPTTTMDTYTLYNI